VWVCAVAHVTAPQVKLVTQFHAVPRVLAVAPILDVGRKVITRRVAEAQLTKERQSPNQRLEKDLRTCPLRSRGSAAQP
jgi:hypothetical protein